MRYSVAKEDGGYVQSNGDIQVIFIRGDVKHGEQGHCPEAHSHSKACAQAELNRKPVVEPAVEADPDAVPPVAAKAEVLGPSMKERGLAWFSALDAKPAAPTAIAIPQKTVKVKGDKGKMVDKQVDDGDLT